VACLTEGVLKTMLLTKLKITAAVLFTGACMGVGLTTLALGPGEPVLTLATHFTDSQASASPPPQASAMLPVRQPPTAEQLVALRNRNARQIQSLLCTAVDLDCKQGIQEFHLRAKLAYRKPRDFRLVAESLGRIEADLGFSDREFWSWIARSERYRVHWSRQDIAKASRSSLPFRPEWILEALGLSDIDPAQPYELVQHNTGYWLEQKTKNTQGKEVRKVTVFCKQSGQVVDHLLMDATGKQEICGAQILEARTVAPGSVILPRKIVFTYPAEKLTVTMTLWADAVVLNPSFDIERARTLFTRPEGSSFGW
jgi:hypothetical protein